MLVDREPARAGRNVADWTEIDITVLYEFSIVSNLLFFHVRAYITTVGQLHPTHGAAGPYWNPRSLLLLPLCFRSKIS